MELNPVTLNRVLCYWRIKFFQPPLGWKTFFIIKSRNISFVLFYPEFIPTIEFLDFIIKITGPLVVTPAIIWTEVNAAVKSARKTDTGILPGKTMLMMANKPFPSLVSYTFTKSPSNDHFVTRFTSSFKGWSLGVLCKSFKMSLYTTACKLQFLVAC